MTGDMFLGSICRTESAENRIWYLRELSGALRSQAHGWSFGQLHTRSAEFLWKASSRIEVERSKQRREKVGRFNGNCDVELRAVKGEEKREMVDQDQGTKISEVESHQGNKLETERSCEL